MDQLEVLRLIFRENVSETGDLMIIYHNGKEYIINKEDCSVVDPQMDAESAYHYIYKMENIKESNVMSELVYSINDMDRMTFDDFISWKEGRASKEVKKTGETGKEIWLRLKNITE